MPGIGLRRPFSCQLLPERLTLTPAKGGRYAQTRDREFVQPPTAGCRYLQDRIHSNRSHPTPNGRRPVISKSEPTRTVPLRPPPPSGCPPSHEAVTAQHPARLASRGRAG